MSGRGVGWGAESAFLKLIVGNRSTSSGGKTTDFGVVRTLIAADISQRGAQKGRCDRYPVGATHPNVEAPSDTWIWRGDLLYVAELRSSGN